MEYARASRGIFVAVAALVLGMTGMPSHATEGSPPRGDTRIGEVINIPASEPDGAGNRYIVTLEPTMRVKSVLDDEAMIANLSGPAFQGAVVQATAQEAKDLRSQDGVVDVEIDSPMSVDDSKRSLASTDVSATAATSAWGLDRSDQLNLPLNGDYSPPGNGAGVDVYVIDSGISALPEFGGRLGDGAYHPAVASSSADCYGHGTHVAGTIGSRSYGIAAGVTLHSVRVLDCTGSGYVSYTIAGMNWVAENAPKRAVVNMSLGGGYSAATNAAANALVARGLVVTVAAGNESDDACYTSPASEPSVITVGAVDSADRDVAFSNFGSCLDLYAPGMNILSSDMYGGPGVTMSGTSMAAPHVAGGAAIAWGLKPNATAAAIQADVLSQATPGIVTFPFGQAGSPNLNFNLDFDTAPSAPSGVTAVAASGRATITWRRPADDGGTPVTGYRATASPGGATCATGGTSCTVGGLTNGQAYTFTVVATNAVGDSPASARSAAVTPRQPVPTSPSPVAPAPSPTPKPAKVKSLRATQTGKSKVTATWKRSTGATTYRIRISRPNSSRYRVWETTTNRTKRWGGLKRGKTYSIQVVAVSRAGKTGPTATVKIRIR